MKKTCGICGGSGQTGHFHGVSRFVITWEECSDCHGTGVIDARKDTTDEKEKNRSSEDASFLGRRLKKKQG